MIRDECIAVFKKHNHTEEQIVNIIVNILGAKMPGTMVELKGLPMKAFLNTSLEIVYNDGKRYGKLEEAIKTFASM